MGRTVQASTAASVVSSMRAGRDVNINAHHANIKEGRFDVDFFSGFDLVLNGLDNLEVRYMRAAPFCMHAGVKGCAYRRLHDRRNVGAWKGPAQCRCLFQASGVSEGSQQPHVKK